MIKIKRGMDIPIQGAPQQVIDDAPAPRAVAVVGYDYIGMKPTMEVREGDRVKCGQLLFTDKKTAGVRYTAPASGVVSAINRGAKRVLQSVVIDLEGDEYQSFPDFTFIICIPALLTNKSVRICQSRIFKYLTFCRS